MIVARRDLMQIGLLLATPFQSGRRPPGTGDCRAATLAPGGMQDDGEWSATADPDGNDDGAWG